MRNTPESLDNAIAAGWPVFNVEDTSTRTIQVQDDRIEWGKADIFPGQDVIVAAPGPDTNKKFATVIGLDWDNKIATLTVWRDEYQPQYA